MRTKVLVCGGRTYSDTNTVRWFLGEFKKRHEHNGVILIHGNAPGADSLADMVGRELGFWVWPCPAMWNKHGKSAGPIRNVEMAESSMPHEIIAFPGGSGTEHMIKTAERFNIPVTRVS